MMKTVLLQSLPSSPLAEARDFQRSTSSKRVVSTVTCSSRSRSSDQIPKVNKLQRTIFDVAIPDPPLIEKTESRLRDYCPTLDVDESYSCWRAYFELKDLETEMPKEDLEKIIRQAGGVECLIECLHAIAPDHKEKKNSPALETPVNAKEMRATPLKMEEERARLCPIPDGLPKSQEELDEEESARMPDSPYTRLLRVMGRSRDPSPGLFRFAN